MNLTDKTIINIIASSSHAFLLLISSIIFTRYLTKIEYGVYLQVMLIVNTTIMITFFGLPQSMFYFTAYVDRRDLFIARNIVISIMIAASASIGVYLMRNHLSVWLNNNEIANLGWLIAIIIMFRAPSKFAEPILISNNYLQLNAILVVVFNLLFFLPVIITALLGKSVIQILNVMMIASMLEFITFFLITLKIILKLKKNVVQKKEARRKIKIIQQIRYSLPIGLSGDIALLAKQLDQYLVSIFFSPLDFAVYSRGALTIPFLAKFHIVINRVLMPKYVKSYKDGDIKSFLYYYHQSIKKVAKIKYPLFTFLFVVSPSLITVLFTEQYLDAVWVFRCYLMSLLINVTVFNLIPTASGKTGSLVHATTISLIVNFVLSILLIKMIGAVGAAIATLFSGTISGAYLLSRSSKLLNISMRELWPWKYLQKLIGITIIPILPVFALEYLIVFNNVPILLMLIVKASIYIYLLLIIMNHKKVISPEEFELMNRWLKFDAKALINKLTFVKANAVILK